MPQARQISKRGGETDSGEFRQGLPFAAVEAVLALGVGPMPAPADLALDSLAILGDAHGGFVVPVARVAHGRPPRLAVRSPVPVESGH